MYIEDAIQEQVISLLSDIENTILSQEERLIMLKEKFNRLSGLIAFIFDNKDLPLSMSPSVAQRVFSRDELAKYNGKSGQPAYVAINGMVYDVTNDAAWAAATHFGLAAGGDYTSEFAACHSGQNILQNLSIVGNLSNG